MEVKILDSIIHGALKPWMIDATNTRRFNELVKASKATTPKTNAELLSKLSALLIDYPILQSILANEPQYSSQIQPLLFHSNLPNYKDGITQFYHIVITSESLRIYNTILEKSVACTELIDIRYQVGKILTNVRVLAKQVSKELIEQGYTTTPDSNSNVVHFTLYFLKHNLIQLYFSIQKHFESKLKQTTTLEDFYLIDLEESLTNLVPLQSGDQPMGKSVQGIAASSSSTSMQIEDLSEENIEIERIEIELRKFIIDKLQIKSLHDYKQVVPQPLQDKIKESVGKEQKKNPALVSSKIYDFEYHMQFLDLRELETILISKNNWPSVADCFGTKENLGIEFSNLAGLRNPVRHSRKVDEVSLLKGRAAIKWFKQQLKMPE